MMKIKLFLFIACLLFCTAGKSQTTAQDFTQTDCEGMPHHLFSELDSGYCVIMEFVMTCNLCIEGGSAIADLINTLPAQYQSKILFYQFAYTNSYTCSTMIAFKHDNFFNSRVFDQGAHMVAYYGGFGMPTVAIAAGANHDVIYSNVGFMQPDTAYAGPAIRNFFETSGIEEGQTYLNNLSVYPNPANEKISVKLNLKNSSTLKLQLVDLSGQLVKEISTGHIAAGEFKKDIDVSEIASGVYMLKATVNNKSILEKFRISH
jgi:hypothetical protein